ncbi:uncharacterized protein [Panulirus ornatus]|uniref:uncharacterized protein n=1 Tax=Panulirus ornatus TaxID=150431 RepID=UPI003A8B3427
MFRQRPAVDNRKQVCSFYLKGKCNFGSRCWYLHPSNQGGTGMANAFGGGGSNVFGAKASTQQDSKEFQDFVMQVSGEMNQWERSGQWLVSCFAPLKAHPLIPGFSDFSPEELRVLAYKALKTNTSNSYQTHWNELQQRYKQLREALKMSSQEAVQAMREVYHAKTPLEQQEQQQTLKPTTLFGKPTGQTVFGGATTQPGSGAGLLGAKPQSSVFGVTPVFGGSQPTTPSLFTGTTNKSVFGGNLTLGAQSTNVFGGQNSAIFGGTGSNVFKNGGQTTQNNNLFGGSSQGQANTSSVFGGGNSASASSPTTSNIFGGNQNKSTASNIFNNNSQNQTSVFGGTGGNKQGSGFQGTQGTTSTGSSNTGGGQGNIFGSQQQGLFGIQQTQQQQPGSVFGMTDAFGTNPPTPVSSAPVQNAAPSVFGGTPSGGNTVKGTTGIFGGNGNAAPSGGGGLFGNMQTAGPFSKPSPGVFGNNNEPNTNTGLFGKPSEALQSSTGQGTSGLFVQHAEGTPNPGGSFTHTNKNPDWYTPLDQLQPADRAQFEAEAFTSIPLCAPPVELCV